MKEVTRFFGKLLLLGFGFVLANACSSFDGNDGPSSGTSGGGSTGSTSGDFWKDYYSWGVPNIYIYPTPGEFDFSELASGTLLFKYQGGGNGAGGDVLVDIANKSYKQVQLTPYGRKFRISPDSEFIAYHTSGIFYEKFWEGIFVSSVGEGKSIQLSSDNENSFNPSWNSDGSKIFFWSTVNRNPSDFALFSIDKNGTNLTKLTHKKFDLKFSAASESPSGLITFSTNQTSVNVPNAGILLLDPKQGLLERIVPKSQGSFLESPVFSPDGKKIAYLNITRSDLVYTYMDVMVWNSDSKSLSKIVGIKASGSLKFDYLEGEDLTPNLVWSPDGNRILFTVPEGNSSLVPEKGVWNLFVINSDGTNLKKITKPSRQIVQYELSWGK